MYVDQWAYKSQGLSCPFLLMVIPTFYFGNPDRWGVFQGVNLDLLGHDAWRKIQEYSPQIFGKDGDLRWYDPKKNHKKIQGIKRLERLKLWVKKSFPPLGDMKKYGHQRVTYVFTQMCSSNTKKGYLPLEGVEVEIFFIFHLHSEICRSAVTNLPSLKLTFSHLKIGRIPEGKEWVVFQASILRCELWVSKRAIPSEISHEFK